MGGQEADRGLEERRVRRRNGTAGGRRLPPTGEEGKITRDKKRVKGDRTGTQPNGRFKKGHEADLVHGFRNISNQKREGG